MKRTTSALIAAALLCGSAAPTRADEKDASAVIDKAVAALGGEAKLTKAGAASWAGKGTITFNDVENDVTTRTVVQGVDRMRGEFQGEFGGMEVKGVTVLDGEKGWRKFGDDPMPLDGEALANERRRAYLQAAPMTLLPLKTKGFKVETAPDETVDGKPAAVLKVTGPDAKTFTLAFDKGTGLPAKLTATVQGFGGEEFKQETTYSDYKEFDGVKRATKLVSLRDGSPFVKMTLSDFKTLETPDPDAFAGPK